MSHLILGLFYDLQVIMLQWLLLYIHRVLELLLKHEARPGISDNQGYNAIHYAALKGHRLALEMVNNNLF